MEEPRRENWADLYHASMEFRQAAPWRWMDDMDLVAVESPFDGQMGYGAVIGTMGEALGLGVFVGEEGLRAYQGLAAGDLDPESFDAVAILRSVSATWVDREVLSPQDRAVIHSLGLRFRGRNGWPYFRSYRPCYLPWYLQREEALLLAASLRQVLEVARRVRDEGLVLRSGAGDDLALTRYYRDGDWQEEWRPLRGPAPQGRVPAFPDEVRLQRLQTAAGKHPGAWEVDWFLVPTPTKEGLGPPYFPTCVMVVEAKVGLIIGTELLGPQPSSEECQEAVVRVAERAEQLPLRIRVATKEALQILGPVAQGLGVSLSVGALSALKEAKESLLRYMRGGGLSLEGVAVDTPRL